MSVEIEVAKLILACFLDEPENEVQRNNLIRGKVAENEKVKKFARFSDEKENSKTAFCSAESNQW